MAGVGGPGKGKAEEKEAAASGDYLGPVREGVVEFERVFVCELRVGRRVAQALSLANQFKRRI